MNSVANGDLLFKIRFNTTHGDSGLYWRIIIGENEYLVGAVHCAVPTCSESSFDERAGAVKFHMSGKCTEFYLDDLKNAYLK
jgi:hypothetical protein